MNNPEQLILPWSKVNKFTFSDFYFESKNSEIKHALKSNQDIFLYGIEEVGKSFLLQAVCNFYGSEKKSSLYVPIKEAIKLNTDFLDSLDNLDVVCIDDIDLIKNNKDWEIAIFNLEVPFSVNVNVNVNVMLMVTFTLTLTLALPMGPMRPWAH